MNKFIKFNSILFSSVIFLLNPAFGMGDNNKDEKTNTPNPLTKEKKRKEKECLNMSTTVLSSNVSGASSNSSSSSSTPTEQKQDNVKWYITPQGDRWCVGVPDSNAPSSQTGSSSSSSSSPKASSPANSSSSSNTNIGNYSNSDLISNLPDELKIHILEYLEYIDIFSMSKASKSWYNICNDRILLGKKLPDEVEKLFEKTNACIKFTKAVNTFKKTKNLYAKLFIQKKLEQSSFEDETLIALLIKKGISIYDIIDLKTMCYLQRFHILARFGEKKELSDFIKKYEEQKEMVKEVINFPFGTRKQTLLMAALECPDRQKSISLAKILTENRDNINALQTDLDGNTALHYIVKTENINLVMRILSSAADDNYSQNLYLLVETKNKQQKTALDIAAEIYDKGNLISKFRMAEILNLFRVEDWHRWAHPTSDDFMPSWW